MPPLEILVTLHTIAAVYIASQLVMQSPMVQSASVISHDLQGRGKQQNLLIHAAPNNATLQSTLKYTNRTLHQLTVGGIAQPAHLAQHTQTGGVIRGPHL